ncbi:MAG: hypothetical protein JWQ35_810 [Bacteriovoracaceae bacterium]|nr:hypothetical protein [Bacteriovoracaceae bacterium]
MKGLGEAKKRVRDGVVGMGSRCLAQVSHSASEFSDGHRGVRRTDYSVDKALFF